MPAFLTGNKDRNRTTYFDEKTSLGKGGEQYYRLLNVSLPAVGQSLDEVGESFYELLIVYFTKNKASGYLREEIKIRGLVSVVIIYALTFLHFY